MPTSPAASSNAPASGGIAPHGGRLVNLLLEGAQRDQVAKEAASLPKIVLDERQINDLDMLTIGALSPMEGFMGSADYKGVIGNTRLESGVVWPIPVVLGLTDEQKKTVGDAKRIALADDEKILAVLNIEETFSPSLDAEAQGVYGTTETAHPGVQAIHDRGKTLVGGKVEAIARHTYEDFPEARLSPAQTRALFASHGWKKVTAFQTRNPIHRAHEYLIRCALEMTDGLLIHPLMGATKKGDIPGDVRWACYNVLLDNYFPKDRVSLAVFPANMNYAGPKEAMYHALVRKNYGVTHFIVGRDHAGVGKYYGSYDAQKIFDNFTAEEIGIEPLKFEHSFWSHPLEGMASFKTCAFTDPKDMIVLSGTKVREMLGQGIVPPEEFTRREIAEILIRHYQEEDRLEREAQQKSGEPVTMSLTPQFSVSSQPDVQAFKPRNQQGLTLWFTGLSGSGKSTITQLLAPILRARGRTVEILDGDEVRENLSKGLGFSKEDRDTNIKRIGYVAKLLTRHGAVTMTAAISPYAEIRDFNRAQIGNFVEIYCEATIEALTARDPKGLYKKAIAGEIKNFTGVSDPYEAPEKAEIYLRTDQETPQQSVEKILAYLEKEGWIR